MAIHLTIDGETTLCGRVVGEVTGEDDQFTTDPDGYNCPECEGPFGAYSLAARAYREGFGNGYAVGHEKAFCEAQGWKAGEHENGCDCQGCRTARTVIGSWLLYLVGDAEGREK